jgi:hypothetical protein
MGQEVILRNAVREYLCYQHEGAKRLLELFGVVEDALQKGPLSREQIIEIINQGLAEPPGFSDPQDLEAEIAVRLMRFQRATGRKIEQVNCVRKDYDTESFPCWVADIVFAETQE